MFSFSRNERLKSRKLISRLFREGNSYLAYPVRVVWLPIDAEAREAVGIGNMRVQLAVSVPKRVFKTAVARNRIKRRIREAFRQNKDPFYEKLAAPDLYVALMLIYVGKEELPFDAIAEGVKKMAKKFTI